MKRRFKKIVAMSMAAFMTLGLCHINVSAAVEDEEDIMPVASITANDVYVFENDTDNEGSYDVKPDHVIVTMLNDDVYEGSMQEVMDQLAEAYPEDTFDIDYELGGEDLADELEIGTYESTVWITYNGVGTEYGLYHFIVADNPILSFEVDDISIYYEDTEHRDEYNGKNADWDAYRAFPISAAIVTSEKEYIGGIDDVIEDFKADYPDYRIDAFAHDDQSPDNKWSRANTYQAYYHLSSFDVPYDVYIADNPVVSTEVFTLTKYDTNIEEMFGYKNEETGEWVEGKYKGYNVWPDFKLILTDGSEYDSRNDGRVEDFIREKTGLNVSVYVESDQSPSNEWGAGEHYAKIHIGDMVTDYIVNVVECPIQSMSVENINVLNGDTRLEVYTTWNQEIEQEEKHSYNRYNAIWPRKLSVTVDGSTYTGDPDEIRDTLREILGYEPDMHSNDGQSEGNEWVLGESYPVEFVIEGKSAEYTATVIDNPFEEVTVVSGCTVFAGTQEEINENGECFTGYRVYPDEIEVKVNGETYKSKDYPDLFGYLGDQVINACYSWGAYTDQSNDNIWETGEHEATFTVAGISTTFKVNVVEYPEITLEVEDLSVLSTDIQKRRGYSDPETGNWVDEEFDGYNTWPEFKITLENGKVITNHDEDVNQKLRDELGLDIGVDFVDDQIPGQLWEAGSHKATIIVGNVSAEYTVTVIPSQIVSLTVDDINVLESDVFVTEGYHDEESSYDGQWFLFNTWPNSITLVTKAKTYQGDVWQVRDEYANDIGINRDSINVFTDNGGQTPFTESWETGETHEASFSFAGISAEYNVSIVEYPIKFVTVKDKYCFDGCYDHRDYYDEENDTHEEFDAYNVWPDEISVTLNDDTVITGNPDYVMNRIREITGVDLEYHIEDEQAPNVRWEIGDHTASFVIARGGYTFNVKVVDVPIQSIEVEDISLFEGDYVTKRGYEDPETHEWVHDSTYQGYNTWPNEITITLTNGKIFKNSDGDLYEALKEEFGFDFPWSNNDDQSPNNMWKTGEHEVTFNIAKYTAAYKVIIIPCDITNVTVNDLYILEGSQRTENGYWDDYQDFTGEWKLYDCYPHFITVETKDKTYSGDAWTVTEEYAKDHNYDVGIVKSYTDNGGQTPFTDVWEAGVYDVSFFFAGYTAGYKVNIIDNPIKSISVADMYDIEGTKFKYNEFDSERQQHIEFMGYSIIPMDITITFEDDSVYSGNPREINEYFNELLGFEPEMHFNSDQSDIIEWGPGEHFANLEIGGVGYTYKITIIENPIESISISDVDVEYGDTVEDDHYWNPETGEVTEVTWNKYVADPEFTIVFKSGETLKGTLDVVLDRISEICEVDRDTIMNDFIDDQSPENVWDLGEHEVTFRLCGIYQNFKVNVIITEPDLEITKQPVNASVNCGSNAKFSVTAECSNYDINYQWQFSSDNGVTWKNSGVTGNKTNTITVPVTYNLNGRIFRCIVTAGEKELITDSVKLTAKPVVSANPKSVSSNVGDAASFAIKSRSTVAKYQWEISKDGGKTWASSKLSGYDTVSISIASVPVTYNGFMFRCKVTNGTWTEYSTAATLTVLPTVIAEPENLTEYYGNIAKFYFKVSGPNLTYQWQVKNANGKWINSSSAGNDTAIIRFTSTSSTNNREFRCIVTSGNNKVISKTVKFNSKSPIITQPTAKSVKAGATAKFTVKAEGKKLSYQWQMWNGSKWVDSSATGAKTNTLSVAAKASLNGKIYRCVVTNGTIKTISNKAKLTVK
ncbi:MAG: hypothetical protein IKQ63_09835 [Eubacterium sp.]|nr:hypothetical protein [Eubacterium sp.]